MEPLSLIAISAAVGGATGKFVEKAWDSGEKWISTFYKDHQELAQNKATENTKDFLQELAQRIKFLEESMQVSKENINLAQNHPDFSVLLQKAILASAQTDNNDKHKILAKIVSERLKTDTESILSLGSKMACDAISYLTSNQLMILGLAANLFSIRPNVPLSIRSDDTNTKDSLDIHFIIKLLPYKDIILRRIDLVHLESLSCLKFSPFIMHNKSNLFENGDYVFGLDKIRYPDLRESIVANWNNGLQHIDLTTVGLIIGISVSDILTSKNTLFEGFEGFQ